MSKLTQLIAELCPEGVEYKTIQEISRNIVSGGTPKTGNKEYYDGNIPWLRTQEINFNDIIETEVKITQLGFENSSAKWIPKNCIIIAMYGATVGKIAINKTPMTTNQACCNIELDETKVLYKYVFHFLSSQYEYIKSLGQGSQTNINAQIIKKLIIPVPPLPVQEEIVRILDNFSQLTTELKAELTARKKQYEYYQNWILDFAKEQSKEIKYLTLGECITKNIGGGTPAKSKVNYWNGNILWASVKDMVKPSMFLSETKDCITKEGLINSTSNIISKGQIIVATRINPGKMLIAQKDIAINQDLRGLILKDYLNPKYLVYYFKTLKIEGKGTTVKGISVQDLEEIIIPIPPIAEQDRIVSILDRFDTLCHDLYSGLPAEIAARQKQYEYYRDKLLTFKELPRP